MSSPPRDLAYLQDMLVYARRVVAMSREWRREDLEPASVPAFAVERCIEIIGEAARHVSTEFRGTHPEIAWQKIVATRHIIAREYGAVNYDTIWRIATIHLPELIILLSPLVPFPPEDPQPEVGL